MASTAACECGTKEQAANYVITSYPIYHHPNGACALSDIVKKLATWLMERSSGPFSSHPSFPSDKEQNKVLKIFLEPKMNSLNDCDR